MKEDYNLNNWLQMFSAWKVSMYKNIQNAKMYKISKVKFSLKHT